jgi:hypothetical protein
MCAAPEYWAPKVKAGTTAAPRAGSCGWGSGARRRVHTDDGRGILMERKRLLGWADDWLGPNARGQPLGLALRRDLIDRLAP